MRLPVRQLWRRASLILSTRIDNRVALQLTLPLDEELQCVGKTLDCNVARTALTQGRRWHSQPISCSGQQTFAAEAAAKSAVAAPSQEASNGNDDMVHLTDAAIEKLKALVEEESDSGRGPAFLRLEVEAGGCSGFSYVFRLDHNLHPDDRLFDYEGAKLVTDSVSFSLLRGATVDYVQELIKSTFEVVRNPNAEGGCGCGSSFSPK
eukprot:jgi/Botrbrau1/9311/Bobra.0111s0035.1